MLGPRLINSFVTAIVVSKDDLCIEFFKLYIFEFFKLYSNSYPKFLPIFELEETRRVPTISCYDKIKISTSKYLHVYDGYHWNKFEKSSGEPSIVID